MAKIIPSPALINAFLAVMLKDRGGSFNIRKDDPLLNGQVSGGFEVVVNGNLATLKLVPSQNSSGR